MRRFAGPPPEIPWASKELRIWLDRIQQGRIQVLKPSSVDTENRLIDGIDVTEHLTRHEKGGDDELDLSNMLGSALSSDPADPSNDNWTVWQSDGTESGEDGNLMISITDSGGTTTTEPLFAPIAKHIKGERYHGYALSSDPNDPSGDEFVIWQSDGTESGEDGDVLAKYTDTDGNTRTRKITSPETIKCHITSAITAPTTGSWTNFSDFSVATGESLNSKISLNSDAETFDVSVGGFFQFGGCVHYQNNTTGAITAIVLSRIYVNGTDEVKCSQAGVAEDINADGEGALALNGTTKLAAGDSFTLQYYTDSSDVDFDSNSNFAATVAVSLWLVEI